MCLALPAKITHIDASGEMATATLGEVSREISLALVDHIEVGDYVLIHVGYALNRVSEEEAQKTLALFAEAGLLTVPATATDNDD